MDFISNGVPRTELARPGPISILEAARGVVAELGAGVTDLKLGEQGELHY